MSHHVTITYIIDGVFHMTKPTIKNIHSYLIIYQSLPITVSKAIHFISKDLY